MRLLWVAVVGLLSSAAYATTLWDDYKNLKLVCYYKTSYSEKAAQNGKFPRKNRLESLYVAQDLVGSPDISASFFYENFRVQFMANSLLFDDERDLALVTTRIGVKSTGEGYGDNQEIPRNGSARVMQFVGRDEASQRPLFFSAECRVVDTDSKWFNPPKSESLISFGL